MAAQAGLSLLWSETPKTGFLMTRLMQLCVFVLRFRKLFANFDIKSEQARTFDVIMKTVQLGKCLQKQYLVLQSFTDY